MTLNSFTAISWWSVLLVGKSWSTWRKSPLTNIGLVRLYPVYPHMEGTVSNIGLVSLYPVYPHMEGTVSKSQTYRKVYSKSTS
jgi:hypothetical protein